MAAAFGNSAAFHLSRAPAIQVEVIYICVRQAVMND
jgi:hypothetical protein